MLHPRLSFLSAAASSIRSVWTRGWAVARSLWEGVTGAFQAAPLPAPSTSKQGTRSPLGLVVVNVVLAVAQAITPRSSGVFGGRPIEEVSDQYLTLITPGDFAFAVWGFIYPACLAYAVYGALPAGRESALVTRLLPWTASAFLANAVWPFFFQRELLAASVLVILWTLTSLVGVLLTVRESGAQGRAEGLVALSLGVFAGWITAATVLNMSILLTALGFGTFLPGAVWGVLVLLLTGVIGSLVTLRAGGNPGYALALIWALVGILVARGGEVPGVGVAAGVSMLLLAGSVWRAREPRASQTAPA